MGKLTHRARLPKRSGSTSPLIESVPIRSKALAGASRVTSEESLHGRAFASKTALLGSNLARATTSPGDRVADGRRLSGHELLSAERFRSWRRGRVGQRDGSTQSVRVDCLATKRRAGASRRKNKGLPRPAANLRTMDDKALAFQDFQGPVIGADARAAADQKQVSLDIIEGLQGLCDIFRYLPLRECAGSCFRQQSGHQRRVAVANRSRSRLRIRGHQFTSCYQMHDTRRS